MAIPHQLRPTVSSPCGNQQDAMQINLFLWTIAREGKSYRSGSTQAPPGVDFDASIQDMYSHACCCFKTSSWSTARTARSTRMRVARYVRRNAILMISQVLLNPLLLILHYINFTVYLLAATDRSTRYYLGVNTEEVVSFFGPCAHACIGTRSP